MMLIVVLLKQILGSHPSLAPLPVNNDKFAYGLCNTVKFLDFRMLLGRIIKQRFWYNFKILLDIYFLHGKFST
jgi:hypothetical protein